MESSPLATQANSASSAGKAHNSRQTKPRARDLEPMQGRDHPLGRFMVQTRTWALRAQLVTSEG